MSTVSAATPSAQGFSTSDAAYAALQANLTSPELLSADHRELESVIETQGREVLRCLLQDHLSLRAQDDLASPPAMAGGHVQTHRRPGETRNLMSIFGCVTVSRIGYTSRQGGTLHPLDATLNLPPTLYSAGVRERVAAAVARGSFEQAAATLKEHGGGIVATRQIQEMAHHSTIDFESFYQQRANARSAASTIVSKDKLLVLTTDAKGVVMRPEGLRESTCQKAEHKQHKRDKRLCAGEKRQAKRMAQVAAVYDIEPWRRTPCEVAKALRPVRDAAPERPRPQSKRVWASILRTPAEVIETMFSEGLSRDPKRQRTWVALVDGNLPQLRALETTARRHDIQITIVLDIIHVLEYLWKAADCFNACSSQEGEDWVNERFLAILSGRVSQVAAGIRRSATRRKLTPASRAAADRCADYLLNHKDYMHYDRYLTQGMPVGTGVIEGACRYLVKDRMEITGARCGLKGAEAVLQLRALHASGDLAEYWKHHAKAELHRNHALRYADGNLPEVSSRDVSSARAGFLRVVK